MNAPITSMVEVSQAAFLCGVMTIAAWLVHYLWINTLVNNHLKTLSLFDCSEHARATRLAHKWHFGLLSIVTCFVPPAVLWISLVLVSLARDSGVVIIPYFIWIPFVLFGVLNVYTQKIRANAIRRILDQMETIRMNKAMDAKGSVTAR